MMNPKSYKQGFLNHKNLLKYRICAGVATTGFVIWRIYKINTEYFYYLTNWNWILLILYFIIATLHQNMVIHQGYSKTLNRCYKGAFTSIQALSWIVSVIFWLLLSDSIFDSSTQVEKRVVETILHSVNLLFPVLDLFFCGTDLYLKHVIYPIFWSIIYEICVVIWKALSGRAWPYPFVARLNGGDDKINWLAILLFPFALGFAIFLFHLLTLGLVWLRNKFTEKKKPRLSAQQTIIQVV